MHVLNGYFVLVVVDAVVFYDQQMEFAPTSMLLAHDLWTGGLKQTIVLSIRLHSNEE